MKTIYIILEALTVILVVLGPVTVVLAGAGIFKQTTPRTSTELEIPVPSFAPATIAVSEPESEAFPVTGQPNVDPDQLHCLAVNIYHEAKGESYLGKLAVAHVTMNRKLSHRFPNNVCEVVYQAKMRVNWKGNEVPARGMCQFSWFCDGKSDDLYLTNSKGVPVKPNVAAWNDSNNIAFDVLLGHTKDPTFGATHYHNPSISDPFWADHFEIAAVVDNHTFYK